MRLRVKFVGFNTVYARSKRLVSAIRTGSTYAAMDAANILGERAISILRSKARAYGASTDPIEQSKQIDIEPKKTRSVATLRFTSKHAAIVEFGAPGWFILSYAPVKMYFGGAIAHRRGGIYRGWPIGKEQGAIVAFRSKVPLQAGYHYLSNAINDTVTRRNMRDAIRGTMWKFISLMMPD